MRALLAVVVIFTAMTAAASAQDLLHQDASWSLINADGKVIMRDLWGWSCEKIRRNYPNSKCVRQ